jgi:CRP-like cAMP-binding protein
MSERLHRLLAEYRAALERDPSNPQLLAAVGQVLEELGYRADAASHYLSAAFGYEQAQQLREAADCCARVLANAPGNLDAVGLLRRLGDGGAAPAAQRVSDGQVVLQSSPTASDYPADMSTENLDRGRIVGPGEGGNSEPPVQGAGTGKRPRLRTKRPRRKVSPLDRTVVDNEVEAGPPSSAAPSSAAPSSAAPPDSTRLPPTHPDTTHPDLAGASRGRVEGTLPRRRPRRTVSPLDRTEVESADRTEVELAAPPAARTPGYELPTSIAQLARSVSFSRGEVVFREGDEGDDVLFVQAGQVQVSRRGPDGPQSLTTLESGDFFGELGMLGDGYRHATTRALRPTRVHVLNRAQTRQLMKDDRAANRALRRAYRDRLQEMLVALSPLLRRLAPSVAERVLGASKPLACPAGTTVMAAGRDAPGLFFVLLGQLDVLSPTGEVMGQLGDGDCFGHVSLLRGEPSDCAVRATRFAQLLRLAPVQLAQLTAEEGSLALGLDQATQRWASDFERQR